MPQPLCSFKRSKGNTIYQNRERNSGNTSKSPTLSALELFGMRVKVAQFTGANILFELKKKSTAAVKT